MEKVMDIYGLTKRFVIEKGWLRLALILALIAVLVVTFVVCTDLLYSWSRNTCNYDPLFGDGGYRRKVACVIYKTMKVVVE